MTIINEITEMLKSLGGSVDFDTPVVCKLTPHTKPEKLSGLNSGDDLNRFSIHMLYTIRQRLKLILYYKTHTQ